MCISLRGYHAYVAVPVTNPIVAGCIVHSKDILNPRSK